MNIRRKEKRLDDQKQSEFYRSCDPIVSTF